MIFFNLDRPTSAHSLSDAAAALYKLADDCTRLAACASPADCDLADAPILDHYDLNLLPMPVLSGAVTGHPELRGSGRLITTSQLYLIAPQEGWARTQTRFYRLGRPANAPRLQA